MAESLSNPNRQAALQMVDLFRQSGADCFDVTLTNSSGDKIRYRPNLTTAEVCHKIPQSLELSSKRKENIIIRPRDSGQKVFFVQLDDLTLEKVQKVEAISFMTIETSPNNYQAWVAVSTEPQTDEKEVARNLRKTAGADLTASGATRLAGTQNFKEKYAPHYPAITIRSYEAGLVVSVQELKAKDLLTTPTPQTSPTPRPIRRNSYTYQNEKKPSRFPDYGKCLQNAPPNSEGNGLDTSRADFTWCMIAIDWGWSIGETAQQLLLERNSSTKRQRDGERYAMMTAQRAAEAVARNNSRGMSR